MKCMYIYWVVFSSPSCSNYVLKRTSVDNEKKIESDTARTLRRNFYVDGMLTSPRGIDEAADLIQRRRNNCKTGGFILKRFVTNKIDMMNQSWRNIAEKTSTSKS